MSLVEAAPLFESSVPAKFTSDVAPLPLENYPDDGDGHDRDLKERLSQSGLYHVMERRGGGIIPPGYNPFGYKITPLGERFLEFGPTCLESDVGRLLASLKTKRKTMSVIQTQWLEIVRVSKTGQSMRIYRTLQDLIDFCLAARLID